MRNENGKIGGKNLKGKRNSQVNVVGIAQQVSERKVEKCNWRNSRENKKGKKSSDKKWNEIKPHNRKKEKKNLGW